MAAPKPVPKIILNHLDLPARSMEIPHLKKSKILQAVHRLSSKRGEEVYLVGGAIRDLLLGKTLGKDFDFVMKGEVGELAKAVAQGLGGHLFPLEESFGTWRVILKKGKRKTEIDFSSMQGRDIFEDLKQRDFTINSLAVSLKEIFQEETPCLIDPLKGISHLSKRTIRANSEESLRQDPLRMLRAFRFASTLKLTIEEETLEVIQKNKSLIHRSAWERIRNEFFTALGENQAGHFLRQLNKTGLLGEIFPEIERWTDLNLGPPKGDSLIEHAFRTVEAGEFIFSHWGELFSPFAGHLKEHFSQSVEEGISRIALFKFLAFFHDSGKPGTMTWEQEDRSPRFLDHDQEGQRINTAIARRMKLSRKATLIISNLTRQHMRIHSLSKNKETTPRAKYRFFHDLGKDGIDLIFLAFSSGLASKRLKFQWPFSSDLPAELLRVKQAAEELLSYYYGEFTKKPEKPFLDGKEVMEVLGLSEGEAVGRILERLREAEIAGKVQSREEALKFLKNIDRSL